MAKIEEDIINDAAPKDSKEKGLAVLGTIITNEAMTFAERMIPTLERQIKNEIKRQAIAAAQQQFSDFLDKCPPEVGELINIRNSILEQANSIVKTIDKISSTINIASTGVVTLINLIKILKTTKTALSTGSKFTPVIPGGVVSGLSDLDDAVTKITFDDEGNAKLPPILASINKVAVPIALISFYISKFISLLTELDNLVKDCISSFPLTPISDELKQISDTQNQVEESSNLSTYKGFILEIEEVSFSPLLNRKKAVGKNASNIVIVQTDLSFTPSDEVLINELKFIIDRNDLTAY